MALEFEDEMALVPLFEVKAAGGGADFEKLLDDFTIEMRAQFDLFRRLRESAEALVEGADEAQAKLARADIKAATDAIALIVRTLEKIDALMRQLERDRIDAEERRLQEKDPAVLRAQVEALIAARVEEAVAARLGAAVGTGEGSLEGLAEGLLAAAGESGMGPVAAQGPP